MGWWRRWLDRQRGRASRPLGLDPGSLRESLISLLAQLDKRRIDCALVGAVALAAHGVVRGTRDLDLLIAADNEPTVHELMSQLGFETLDRGESVSSYLLGHLRVDFLLARRAYGRDMLARAESVPIDAARTARVVRLEDLLALKLQAVISNPDRGKDRLDIEALLQAHAGTINMDLVRDIAKALGAERALEEILDVVHRRRG